MKYLFIILAVSGYWGYLYFVYGRDKPLIADELEEKRRDYTYH